VSWIDNETCFREPLGDLIKLLRVIVGRGIHVEGIQSNPLAEVVVAERNLLEISGGYRE
jgi:hypothetical protein